VYELPDDRRRIPGALLAALLPLLACAAIGPFVWVDDYAAEAQAKEKEYVIAPGDLISVSVYKEEGMSARGKVRPDGKISLPFLNDVEAAGYTPSALAQQLQTRLKEYKNLPVVTVSIEEQKAARIYIVGEVTKQGEYPLDASTGMLQALALAGGLNDFAHRDRIFVVRSGAPRIRFRFEDLTHGAGRAAQFALRSGDTIVVE
jgi:polysaccharide export outer membrane protein